MKVEDLWETKENSCQRSQEKFDGVKFYDFVLKNILSVAEYIWHRVRFLFSHELLCILSKSTFDVKCVLYPCITTPMIHLFVAQRQKEKNQRI